MRRSLTRITPGSTVRRRVSHTPNTITAPPATCAIPTGSARTIAPRTTAPKGTTNWDTVTRDGPTRRIALKTRTLATAAANAPEYRIPSTAAGVTSGAGEFAISYTPNGSRNRVPPSTAHAVAWSGSTWRSIRVPAIV